MTKKAILDDDDFDELFFKVGNNTAAAASKLSTTAAKMTTAAMTTTTTTDDDTASIASSSSLASTSTTSSSSAEEDDDDSSGLSLSVSSSSSSSGSDNDSVVGNSIHDNNNMKMRYRTDDKDGKENRMPPPIITATKAVKATASGRTSKTIAIATGSLTSSGGNNNNSNALNAATAAASSSSSSSDNTNLNTNDFDKEKNDDDELDLVEIFSRSSPIQSTSVNDTVVAQWEQDASPPLPPPQRIMAREDTTCFNDNDDERPQHQQQEAEEEEQQQQQKPHGVMENANHHRDLLDSLDKDALAELDENDDDSINEKEPGERGDGVVELVDRRPTKTAMSGTASSRLEDEEEETSNILRNNFTITYNCEKKECAIADDDLLEFSDDDDNVVDNSALRKKTRSSNDDDCQQPDDKSNADSFTMENNVGADLNVASVMEASCPGSPTSSLDTPREMESPTLSPPIPPPAATASPRRSMTTTTKKTSTLEENTTLNLTIRTLKRGMNPYQSKTLPTRQEKHYPSTQTDRLIDIPDEHSLESPRALLPRGSNINNSTYPVPNNSSTKDATTTRVVALPDIGLSPDVQLSELHRFGIDHSHIAPPPYTHRPDPIIHKFNSQNRPPHSRRNIAVDKVFSHPVLKLWKMSNKFHSFNHLQSEMVNVLANSDDNVIVSAPTGAGKTVLFEMAMARLLASNIHQRGGGGGGANGSGTVSKAQKILYLAPNKALCEERQLDWSKRLAGIDPTIVCTTITGGPNASSTTSYTDIASSHLIITTAEKWDSITRRWNEQFMLLSSIKLVLVDEVHMIGEPERGGCLESVLCRMKTIQRVARVKMLTSLEIASSSYKHTTPSALASNMRIVAVSATLPNIGHLASFVESGEAYSFDQSYRPVPLNVFVQACGHIGSNRYLFDKSLNQHVPSILKRFSSGRPAIVFCHSKKETEDLAGELTKSYANPSMLNESALVNFSGMTETSSLHQCIRKGIAFHHAGLDASDRRLVEQAFGSGSISCLCATSTLAVGVNLPSHLVVVKGTSAYRGASEGHQDIDTGTLLQMIGRAGRPGFDTSGTAVIMTDTLSKTRFENMSQGLKVVESHLMDDNRLTEVLNIEISQGVITSEEDAVNWVKGTFLYRRLKSHPLFYGFNGNGDDALHSFVLGKCADSIDKLRKIRAIEVKDDDATFSPTPACHVMSRNFIDFETMKDIIKLPHNSGPVQLLHMISNCSKIQTPVRRHEKKFLNEAYKRIKYKLEGPQSKIRIQTPAEKTFVMLQAAIGRHYFDDFALRQQLTNIIDGASQVLSAIEQYAKEGSRNGQLATQGILFRRSLFSSLWGENDGVLNQIHGVTEEIAAKLKGSGISTFADVLRSFSEDIVNACNVSATFADSLRDAASTILQRTLKLSACSVDVDGKLSLCVKLVRRTTGSTEETSERIVSYSLIVFTDRAGGLLHYSENITKECEITVPCPDKFGRAYLLLVGNLVGLDEQVTVDGNDDIEKSPALLSHSVSKPPSTTVKTQRQQSIAPPPSSSKRPLETHRDSVSYVSDLRMQKRGKVQTEQTVDRIISEPVDTEAAAQPSTSTKNLVTPSPHPHTKHQNADTATPRRNVTSSSGKRDETNTQPRSHSLTGHRPNNPSLASARANRGGKNNSRSSWFQEKSQQKTAQQTAFNSPKENPFASYSFDPNNIENSLDSNAGRSIEQVPTQSIIPNFRSNATYSTDTSRCSQSFRTPGNRRKNTAVSNRISSASVLQQKASELQQHHSQMVAPRYTASDGYNTLGNPTEYGRGMSQYEYDRFTEINRLNDPGMMSQSTYYYDRPGTSTGSVMQRSFSAAPGPTRTPPPYSIGCGNTVRTARNNTFMRGPVAENRMPVSSYGGQTIASRLHTNNFSQNSHPYQANTYSCNAHDFQSQNEFHFPMHGHDGNYPGYNYGMSQQQLYGNPLSVHPHHGFDPRTSHVDHTATDAFYGHTLGNSSIHEHLSYEGIGGTNTSVFQACSFGNMDSHTQTQPAIRSGGYTNLPTNPYQHDPPRQQQQAYLPVNPYKTNQQQRQHLYYNEGMHANDCPPMQEVVVQNSSVRSGLAGDDASRFDDAFL